MVRGESAQHDKPRAVSTDLAARVLDLLLLLANAEHDIHVVVILQDEQFITSPSRQSIKHSNELPVRQTFDLRVVQLRFDLKHDGLADCEVKIHHTTVKIRPLLHSTSTKSDNDNVLQQDADWLSPSQSSCAWPAALKRFEWSHLQRQSRYHQHRFQPSQHTPSLAPVGPRKGRREQRRRHRKHRLHCPSLRLSATWPSRWCPFVIDFNGILEFRHGVHWLRGRAGVRYRRRSTVFGWHCLTLTLPAQKKRAEPARGRPGR
jgi:hypothetical protein